MKAQPSLTFFCELEAAELKDLFSDSSIIDMLVKLNARVSLGLLDLSEERAAVVRQLNESGVPVDAWLLLPKDQGYWFNLDNVIQAVEMYQEFNLWTADNNLHWDAVGLDIEPDIRLLNAFKVGLINGIRAFGKRMLRLHNRSHAREIYHALVKTIRQDSYRVESYQMPLIVDDRKAHSRFIQNLSGIMDLPVDREVLMLYSSFYRPQGNSILCSYAPSAGGVGIGITGGGIDTEGIVDSNPLTWDELKRDLLLASHWSQNLYIFSLEGCAAQGFLEKITAVDWQEDIPLPTAGAKKVDSIRGIIQAFLWLASRPLLLFSLVLVFLILVRRWKPRSNKLV